jgi:hypothetical protein
MSKHHEREDRQVPVVSNEIRAQKMGGFFIRETLLKQMRQGIDSGLAFADAAKAAGIPYELVLAQLPHNDDLREWYRECSGRRSLIRAEDADVLPETKNPLQLKHDLVNKLFAAGLGDRFAEAAAHIRVIDPETGEYDKEGMNVLGFFGKFVLNHLLPKETENTNQEKPPEPVKELTDEQLMQELVKRREQRLQLQTQADEAKRVRQSGGARLKGPEKDE